MQESAATLAKLWWVILLLVGGICVIAFSQLTFSTGEKVEATIVSTGMTAGIAGDQATLIVKTDEGVTSEVTAKGAANVGDRVTLNVLDRIVFRDKYRLE